METPKPAQIKFQELFGAERIFMRYTILAILESNTYPELISATLRSSMPDLAGLAEEGLQLVIQNNLYFIQ